MEHNIGQWIAKRALLNPTTEAVVDITSGQRQTYTELDARCNQVGNGLVAGGLEAGDRVATLLMNGWWNSISRSVPAACMISSSSGREGSDFTTTR